jgi:hypothetical protein
MLQTFNAQMYSVFFPLAKQTHPNKHTQTGKKRHLQGSRLKEKIKIFDMFHTLSAQMYFVFFSLAK